MKIKITALTLSSLLALTMTAKAANINVPYGCFQGLSTNVNFPLSGTQTYGLGSWTVQLTGTLNLLPGSMKVGTAAAINGPTPVAGTNELGVTLPLGVGAGMTIWQNLTNTIWQPDSTYALTVDLDPATSVNVLASTTLALMDGSGNNVGTISGSTLAGAFNSGTGYNSVTLTVKTGTTAPSGSVGIYLSAPSVATVGGSLYVDDFTLAVVTNSVVLKATGMMGTNLTLNASGGAPNQNFQVITSTNLVLPAPSWTLLSTVTNQFDTNGNCQLNVKIDPTMRCRFYRLVLK